MFLGRISASSDRQKSDWLHLAHLTLFRLNSGQNLSQRCPAYGFKTWATNQLLIAAFALFLGPSLPTRFKSGGLGMILNYLAWVRQHSCHCWAECSWLHDYVYTKRHWCGEDIRGWTLRRRHNELLEKEVTTHDCKLFKCGNASQEVVCTEKSESFSLPSRTLGEL